MNPPPGQLPPVIAETRAAPTPPRERILSWDVIRGVALFGIFVVNLGAFSGPELMESFLGFHRWEGEWTLDAVIAAFIASFFQGKFIAIFAFLFGFGIMHTCLRLRENGKSPAAVLSRRLAVLLLFGILHIVLLWFGDILTVYALLGFGVLLIHRCPTPVILAIAFAALLFSVGLNYASSGSSSLFESKSAAAWWDYYRSSTRAYASGTWAEILPYRLSDFRLGFLMAFPVLAHLLAYMIFGAGARRARILQGKARLPYLGIIAAMLFVFAAPLNIFVGVYQLGAIATGHTLYLFYVAMWLLAVPLLSLAYLLALHWAVSKAPNWPIWRWIAATGKMPLTNYLGQSLIATSIFYGYGGGLYDMASPALCLALAIGVYVGQVAASVLWLKAFRFGPMEWLWRRLSYGSAAFRRAHRRAVSPETSPPA